MVRDDREWSKRFPEPQRSDIAFLINHPSGENLKTHLCMGAGYTDTFKTADHTRVSPHILFAAEIALEMAARLKLSPRDTRDVVAAVAGHDQGHIFASHQSETAINSFPEFDGGPGRPKFCHEERTKELFSSPEFVDYFGATRVGRITSILYDSQNPLSAIVDWSDRLAYLLADSIHLGIVELIEASNVRGEFIRSLERLPDGTIGFNNLSAVRKVSLARDMLYQRVAEGAASTLFKGFLVEAYHRAVEWNNTTPTDFAKRISELSTPEARLLFHPKDQPRLLSPQKDPSNARPVDLDFVPAVRITLDMLPEKGRALALGEPVEVSLTTPACRTPRAGMSGLEHFVRSHLSTAGGSGFLERIGGVIGTAHMAPKRYNVRHRDRSGEITPAHVCGVEHWELFVALPKEPGVPTSAIHNDLCSALIKGGIIKDSSEDGGVSISKLRALPSQDLFTRG
jgi:hypothetical protein